MPQIIELSWIPVKQEFESHPTTKALKVLEQKLHANSNILSIFEGVHGHGALDTNPIRGVDRGIGELASATNTCPIIDKKILVWTSVEDARIAKKSHESDEAAKLWGQIVETSSHYGPVRPWTDYFLMEGDDFEKVAGAAVVRLSGSYLPAETDEEAFYESWKSFVNRNGAEVRPAGLIASVQGWAVGDLDHKGNQKKVFMVVTGWEDDASMKAAAADGDTTKMEDFKVHIFEHITHFEKIK